MHLAFGGIERPVALIECDELAAGIAAVLRGWRIDEVPAKSHVSPVITIRRTEDGYRRESEWLSEPAEFDDPVDAVCDFLVDLIKCYVAGTPKLLCLHSAAVRFGRGLAIIPSAYRAGKSTLAVHLAAAGARVFADDVLPLGTDNQGIAPGVLPRLRLPLRAQEGESFHGFVERRRGPASERYLYVELSEAELAPLGTAAPIRTVVLLDRVPEARPDLLPVGTGEVLKRTILRNFAYEVSALDTLDRLHALVAGARCFSLRYDGAEEAARLLCDELGGCDR